MVGRGLAPAIIIVGADDSAARFLLPNLWVDFEYKHYLKDRNGKHVGYLFYWEDFNDYPIFENLNNIPEIRLPVRTEHSTIEEIQ